MSLKVFGCPGCQQPFQVGHAQAGQVVQCPSCAQTVEIPASAFADEIPPPPASPMVFQCPMCTGQFGVTQEMDGQQVACPHCQSAVQIQITTSPEPSFEPPIEVKINERKKEVIPEDVAADLFAPGFIDPKNKKKPTPEKQGSSSSAKQKNVDSATANKTSRSKAPRKKALSGDPTTEPLKVKRRSKTPSVKSENSGAKPKPRSEAPQPKNSATPESSPSTPQSNVPPAQQEPPPVFSEVVESGTPELTPPTSDLAPPTSQSKSPPEPTPIPEEDTFRASSIAHLLPPKFDVLDPEHLNFKTGSEAHKILLPDGQGGTAQLDKRVLRVEHGGEHVSLVALTPEQRKRRRTIQNVIAIVIAIAVMAVAFSILTR